MRKATVQEFIHKRRFRNESTNDKSRCEFSVYEHDRTGSFHQCERKPTEFIEGVGFCKNHAGKVKQAMGLSEATKIRFAATFKGESPVIVKLQVVSETDKTIHVKSVEEVLGSSYGIYSGTSRKDSQYTRMYTFFDDYESALVYLYAESQERILRSKSTLESNEKVSASLMDEIVSYRGG